MFVGSTAVTAAADATAAAAAVVVSISGNRGLSERAHIFHFAQARMFARLLPMGNRVVVSHVVFLFYG